MGDPDHLLILWCGSGADGAFSGMKQSDARTGTGITPGAPFLIGIPEITQSLLLIGDRRDCRLLFTIKVTDTLLDVMKLAVSTRGAKALCASSILLRTKLRLCWSGATV